jgi:hypothetical protein
MSNGYSFTVQGIPVTSNYPPNQSPPSGTTYKISIKFNIPLVNWLADIGYSLNAFALNLEKQLTGYGNITNINVWAEGYYTLNIQFTASSPPVVVVIGIIVGLIVLAYIVNQIIVNLTVPSGPGGVSPAQAIEYGSIALVVVAVAGTLIYFFGRRR